ncbi:hypothetical protein FV232_02960 [Methylobacterium sp. WL30]|uniref:hypothetical protein n=1 Tax=unclassified Methylobacterium TaxID=2615210 RepID=UPI0011C70C0D|nr:MULTISPECIES: hypothetical protein [unclassified Methylobacterium]TXN26230.1 hypothetical protein FV225_23675 [Methylobacterium sp. WL93]TXN43703.1 hypothetical protein FV227_27625 [Methylobacterium sp. WL119]TXN70291.1 hypothetical protein FV232_02960 [Methylobacterium sp. WL30]
MNIFHQKLDTNKHRATITSDGPILVTYHDLIEMVDDIRMTPDSIAFCLRHDDCPTPINHDDSIDGAPEDGIWVYDRLIAFFDWMANRSAYALLLTGEKAGTLGK